jgi:hypothetical protein
MVGERRIGTLPRRQQPKYGGLFSPPAKSVVEMQDRFGPVPAWEPAAKSVSQFV